MATIQEQPTKGPRNMPLSVAMDRLTPFDKELLDLRAKGVSYKEIARILGRAERMLTSRVSSLRKIPQTVDEEEAARKEAARNKACGNVPRTEAEMLDSDRTMVQMYIDGESFTAISVELCCDRKTVSARLIKLREALGTDVVPHLNEVEVRVLRAVRSPVPATIPCLCCRREFRSFDRMRNRICGSCKTRNEQIYDAPEAIVLA